MVRREELQERISTLLHSGWTLAALADELDIHYTTLARWRVGARYPENSKAVLMALDGLADKKPPPRRRYPEGHYMQRAKAERERRDKVE